MPSNECFLFSLKKYWNVIHCLNEHSPELWLPVDSGPTTAPPEEGQSPPLWADPPTEGALSAPDSSVQRGHEGGPGQGDQRGGVHVDAAQESVQSPAPTAESVHRRYSDEDGKTADQGKLA